MTSYSWQSELARFRSLSQADQLIWLSRLLHVISMAARDTYEIGTDGVAKPINLRRFNELVHRIASFQKTIAMPGAQGMPDTDLFDLLDHELSALDVRADEVSTTLDIESKLLKGSSFHAGPHSSSSDRPPNNRRSQ